jgi:dihydropteroate synthase
MGVLNVTPDSFSDGGRHDSPERALAHAQAMVAQGADLIDIGGESTRPGAAPVDVESELSRVIPVVEAVADHAAVSIDTRHAEVAEAAVRHGAQMINDVSGRLGPVAARLGCDWVCMHMAGEPGHMQDRPDYDDVMAEVIEFLVPRAERALSDGAREVWIDPGFGFGKTQAHNLELLNRLAELVATGFPVAVGTSRKSTLGAVTARSDAGAQAGSGHSEPTDTDDRREASIASAVWAVSQGATMVRAHDVRAHVTAVRLMNERDLNHETAA